jgi:hypothetical protein
MMRLFKRKKKKVTMHQVPLPVLIRQVIYDTMLTPPEDIANYMGLPPISEDVSEMEELASQERISKFGVLLPFIDAHADIVGKITSAAYVLEDKDDPIEQKDIEQLHVLFRTISLSAALSCISTLISLGLLEPTVKGPDAE